MAGIIQGNSANLYDQDTGRLVGYVNPVSGREASLPGASSAGLSGVAYNGSNQVTSFTFGSVSYAVTYPTGEIVVTGSDGSVQTISLDGSGRIEAVA